jgi:hypothetical protein
MELFIVTRPNPFTYTDSFPAYRHALNDWIKETAAIMSTFTLVDMDTPESVRIGNLTTGFESELKCLLGIKT